MPLKLFYLTNNVDAALIAEKAGVDRIWVDLEVLNKEERQKNINSVKSHHTLADVKIMASKLSTAELMVRVNPWNINSTREIDEVIKFGAQVIMLPMWKTVNEVKMFISAVRGRAKTLLLLETKEANECLDKVLLLKGVDEIHIGLNDLHLSYGLSFMFELLTNGTVENIINRIKTTDIPYGFGGISHIGDGLVRSEMIIMEHYRLGSSMAILSRGFCPFVGDLDTFSLNFSRRLSELRFYEENINPDDYIDNCQKLKELVGEIVNGK